MPEHNVEYAISKLSEIIDELTIMKDTLEEQLHNLEEVCEDLGE